MSELLGTMNGVGLTLVMLILFILVVAFVVNILLIIKYKRYENDLNDQDNRTHKRFDHMIMNDIVSDYTKAGKRHQGEINTQAIIEKHFGSRLRMALLGERFVKTSVSLMIILGLVGTFYGLTLSIAKLVTLLSEDVSSALVITDSITSSLVNSLTGMSVAFVTSLFGIGASIIMTLLNLFFNVSDQRMSVMVHLEEYLDNILAKEVRDNIIVDSEGNVVAVGSSMEKFGSILEESFKGITDTLSHRLTDVTLEMAKTAESINHSVSKFDLSLQAFSDSTRDFKEFNHHLKDNIQRMSLSFSDFAEELKFNTQKIAKGYETMSALTDALKDTKQV